MMSIFVVDELLTGTRPSHLIITGSRALYLISTGSIDYKIGRMGFQ